MIFIADLYLCWSRRRIEDSLLSVEKSNVWMFVAMHAEVMEVQLLLAASWRVVARFVMCTSCRVADRATSRIGGRSICSSEPQNMHNDLNRIAHFLPFLAISWIVGLTIAEVNAAVTFGGALMSVRQRAHFFHPVLATLV